LSWRGDADNDNGGYDIALVRYNIDGSLDLGFGTGGKVTTPIGIGNSSGLSVVLQSNQMIIVAGYSWNGSNADFAAVRYTASGALDVSFGTSGKVTADIGGGDDRSLSAVLQSDGRIVLAGYHRKDSIYDFALIRYNTNGTLDTSFGTGGKVITPLGIGDSIATSVALQSDGKIVAAGSSLQLGGYDFALVRYTANGVLDTSFGTDGKVATPIGSLGDHGTGVALQRDGKIVVAGYSDHGRNDDFALARYDTNGRLDTSFGTGGTTTTAITDDDEAFSIVLQSDGKIILAGGVNTDSASALVRYNTDGSLDTSFGTGGKVIAPIGGVSLALQSDGEDCSCRPK
jgi:uncharacterized delta-60 repeat protein